MRVLVTGAGGLLGGRLAALLSADGFDVVAVRRRAPAPAGVRSIAAELTDDHALARLLDDEAPDAVVHAAVLSRADECERRPDLAQAVNARLPGRVAAACRARGVRLVGLSTDLVLGGGQPWSNEQVEARPLGAYGRTKRAGETALLAADPSAAVVRVALVVGRGHGPRGTASEAVAWALGAGRGIRLYEDEHRTPVDPESVADALARLLTRGGEGLFHVGGPERLSRLALGRRVADALGLAREGIAPGRQADHPGPDPRPADTSLDSTRARRELGWTPRSLDPALRDSRPPPNSGGGDG
jgi:dTDP-4-dehydrorhamnose reductase